MLFRDDVLDVVDKFAMLLFASRGIQLLARVRPQVLPGFQLENRDDVRCVDQRFIFVAFVFTQRPVIGTLGETANSFLNNRRELQFDHPARGLRVQTAAHRLQQTIDAYYGAHVFTVSRAKPLHLIGVYYHPSGQEGRWRFRPKGNR